MAGSEALERTVDSEDEETRQLAKEFEEFAYAVSNNIETPLSYIKDYHERLIGNIAGRLSDRERQYVDYIDGAVNSLESMLQGMMNFSQLNTHRSPHVYVQMQPLVVDLVRQHFSDMATCITVQPLPNAICEKDHIIEVWKQLITNALLYQPDDEAHQVRVEISGKEDGDMFVFCVRDNGIGIEEKQWEAIFGILRRLHRNDEYPGAGLGLSLVRKIVGQHGGKVWLESTPGKGSAFYFTIAKKDGEIIA